ncbi:MAG TPA: pyridoxal-phosphate dependent enzyme, partial [Anaerolineaceae bacterium]|nr:pyridoxal-phosphate dependent enzyme [Anaerolineaceae bacterium]
MNPRLRLGTLPTPVEPLPRLSARLGCQLFVKRDDMTGIAFGGNKVRKLEFVLADAVAHGAKTIITVGAAQSNHCRITAALSAKLGLHCILVLSGSPPENPNGNLLLDYLLGTEIVWSTREQRDEMLKQTFDEAWAAGKRPFLIPLGASTPVGTLGYLEGFREFIQQGVEVDWIVVASSSAGTQAGLVLGAIQAGWNGRILG